MPALDRAALRMGTAELLTRDDVPPGVVLSEVVELALRFSTDGSGRFVNGLLARIAREVRPGTSVEARSEEHTSALQSLLRSSYAVSCLKKNNTHIHPLFFKSYT